MILNYEKVSNLPIAPFLDQICQTLKESPSRFLVLTAQTAAGKSTAVPLALLKNFEGKILMLEPRRLAAVAIAGRVADLLDEQTGQTSGYRLHLENKISENTRFEVMTEAILTRRLQKDPSLEGVNVVVLDEFHERSVHADLALAFLKEAMELRDDLYVIIMSATMDAGRISRYLANPPAPVMEIPGRQFDVSIEYDDKSTPAQAILNELNRPPLKFSGENQKTEKKTTDGDSTRTDTILCFLPGIYEITKTKSQLEEKLGPTAADTSASGFEILILHSSISLTEQKKILSPVSQNEPRRIILSSAIAETSLTVPGVSTVIDSGVARLNKMNVALGMEQLVTEKVSQFSADQRSGRAGRLMEGRCIRLWNKFDLLNKEVTPEILRTDLSQLVLECAQWGALKPSSLDWLDTPSAASWKTSCQLLEQLGLVQKDQSDYIKITPEGRAALTLGLSPRLACTALFALKHNLVKQALQLILKFSEYKNSSPQQQEKFLSNLERRLQSVKISDSRSTGNSENTTVSDTNYYNSTSCTGITSALLLAGFPDRLARKENDSTQNSASRDSTLYQFTSGRKAILQKTYSACPQWIIAPEVNAGDSTGKIWSYEEIPSEELENWLKAHSRTIEKAYFAEDGKKLKKSQLTVCGQLVLKETAIQPSPDDFKNALCSQINECGFSQLPGDKKLTDLILRCCFFTQNARLPSDKEKAEGVLSKLEDLTSTADQWLIPFLTGNSISPEKLYDALYWWLEGALIDEKVPSVLVLPNGKKGRILYENRVSGGQLTIDSLLTTVRSASIQPVLEIIIQQIFGCFQTPSILGVPVLLKLLSPARRPLQITDDLEHFWNGAWIEICKEMKGRYPKHNWDYRISEE